MYYNADLHVHVGRSKSGKPIKITASRQLTLKNILKQCIIKGIDIIGVVDCASPEILDEIKDLVMDNTLEPVDGGGYLYKEKVLLILSSEIEVGGDKKGSPHLLCFLSDIKSMARFTKIFSKHIKNINLSSQRCNLSSIDILKIVNDLGGFIVPAHVFTPFKSYYGSSTDRLRYVFKEYFDDFNFIELGLSSDTNMADTISELENKIFLSDSDAHSLQKIGREFNVFDMDELNFESIKSVNKENYKKVIKNYGLNPALGKYHRTFCKDCNMVTDHLPPVHTCTYCGSKNVIFGVKDRIFEIQDQNTCHPTGRPEYIYNIPLEFIPGIGPKYMKKLYNEVGTEIFVLHIAPYELLKSVIGEKLARNIIKARNGDIKLKIGGGGTYGKII